MRTFATQILIKPTNIHFKPFNSWALAIKNADTPVKALNIYTEMHRKSVPFDSFSILFALKKVTQLKKSFLLQHLHAHVVKLGFLDHVYVATSLLHTYVVLCFDDGKKLFDELPEKNVVTWNTMIKGFSKLGQVSEAENVFYRMPEKDLASWSNIIACYVSNGDLGTGLAFFRKFFKFAEELNFEKKSDFEKKLNLEKNLIFERYLKPDQIMLGSVLSACGQTGSVAVLLGKSVHGYMVRNCWDLNVELGTVLVDMYAKGGLLNKASKVFVMMEDRNIMSWTVLICGAAQNGYGNEALSVFEKMLIETRIRPNELTFTGVLSACAQTGLVEKGQKYFRMIEELYGLEPTIQHYGCLVDMFGKAGLVEEAYKVIETMRLEPNIVIWGSFLTACKLHRQYEMAESVIDRVMKMVNPDKDGGVYSIICDIYVLSNKLDEAESLRNLMENRNVKKPRALSFINMRAA